jgi:hypothetical protein
LLPAAFKIPVATTEPKEWFDELLGAELLATVNAAGRLNTDAYDTVGGNSAAVLAFAPVLATAADKDEEFDWVCFVCPFNCCFGCFEV